MSLTLPPPYEGLRFGPVDPEVGLLKIEGEADGDTIATLVNFACHPVSSTDRMYEITADYPGYAMDLVESVEGGICLFALGCAGNIVPIQRKGRSKRQVGLSLGGCALKALQWIQTSDRVRIRAASRTIDLPLRNGRSQGRKSRTTEIQVFWLGDVPAIGLPGEVFVELGLRIKKALDASPALVVSLSNDSAGYIPVHGHTARGAMNPACHPTPPAVANCS